MAKQCQCPSCTAQRAYRDNATVERVRSRVLANAKARGLSRPHDSYAIRKHDASIPMGNMRDLDKVMDW